MTSPDIIVGGVDHQAGIKVLLYSHPSRKSKEASLQPSRGGYHGLFYCIWLEQKLFASLGCPFPGLLAEESRLFLCVPIGVSG